MKMNIYCDLKPGKHAKITGRWIRISLALVFLISTVTTVVSAKPSDSSNRNHAVSQQMPFQIGPSDVLSISVLNRKELDRTVTVRPDGKLSFSLVGDISAAGLTPLELQTVMEEALGKFINIIPGEVSVVVDEVHSYVVSVLGEVRLPGRFEFQKQVSVLDALAQAGGLTEFADSSRILILRNQNGKTEKIKFNYKKWLKAKSDSAWVLLLPGDIVMVP